MLLGESQHPHSQSPSQRTISPLTCPKRFVRRKKSLNIYEVPTESHTSLLFDLDIKSPFEDGYDTLFSQLMSQTHEEHQLIPDLNAE